MDSPVSHLPHHQLPPPPVLLLPAAHNDDHPHLPFNEHLYPLPKGAAAIVHHQNDKHRFPFAPDVETSANKKRRRSSKNLPNGGPHDVQMGIRGGGGTPLFNNPAKRPRGRPPGSKNKKKDTGGTPRGGGTSRVTAVQEEELPLLLLMGSEDSSPPSPPPTSHPNTTFYSHLPLPNNNHLYPLPKNADIILHKHHQNKKRRVRFAPPRPTDQIQPDNESHSGVGFSSEPATKKRRVRPRKNSPKNSTGGFSPAPVTQMAPQMDTSGGGTPGVDDFTPHVIVVQPGEDVASKILAFSQQEPHNVCILAAHGAISNVTLHRPAMSGGMVTYEGRFEILSLSGSFLPSGRNGSRNRTGGLTVTLAGSDGGVLGGRVTGMLRAASPVQVVVGSFIVDVEKPKPVPSSTPSTPPSDDDDWSSFRSPFE